MGRPFGMCAPVTLAIINPITSPPRFSSLGALLPDRWALDFISRRDVTKRSPSLYGALALTGRGVTIYVLSSGVHNSPYFDNRLTSRLGVLGLDTTGHGTSMACVAAARRYGVAPQARLESLNVTRSDGTIDLQLYQQAINSILQQPGPGLVLTSVIRGPQWGRLIVDTDLDVDMRRLLNAGWIVVAPAGDGLVDPATGACIGPLLADVCHPAHFKDVITVGAVAIDRTFPLFTNYGGAVDVFAPGVDVATLDATGQWVLASSTRVAAAVVAGILALYLEKFPQAKRSDVQEFVQENFFRHGNADPYPLDRLQKDPFENEEIAGPLALRSADGWPYHYLVDTKVPFTLAHAVFTSATVSVMSISLGSTLANTLIEIPLNVRFKNLYDEFKPCIYRLLSFFPAVGEFEVGEYSGTLFGRIDDVQSATLCQLEVAVSDGVHQHRAQFTLHIQPNYVERREIGGSMKARLRGVSGLNISTPPAPLRVDVKPPPPTTATVPVSRDVRLLTQFTTRFVGKTVTPLATGEFLFTVPVGTYQAVVLDEQDRYAGTVIDQLRATEAV